MPLHRRPFCRIHPSVLHTVHTSCSFHHLDIVSVLLGSYKVKLVVGYGELDASTRGTSFPTCCFLELSYRPASVSILSLARRNLVISSDRIGFARIGDYSCFLLLGILNFSLVET
jgi:hypothetical protein